MKRVPIRVEPYSFNDIYATYFPVESPARISLRVAPFPGPLDIEIDCVAVI